MLLSTVLPSNGHTLPQTSLSGAQQWVTAVEPGGDRQLKQTIGSLQSMLTSEVQPIGLNQHDAGKLAAKCSGAS